MVSVEGDEEWRGRDVYERKRNLAFGAQRKLNIKMERDVEVSSEAGAAGALREAVAVLSAPEPRITSAVLFCLPCADSVCNSGRFLNKSVPPFSWEWQSDSCLLGV